MKNPKLNLVLHNIVKEKSQIKNRFTITGDYLVRLLERFSKSKIFTVNDRGSKKISVNLFFDDGYKSFLTIAKPVLDGYNIKAKVGITTQLVGKEGYLSKTDLQQLEQEGFSFCSHGVSHAALCIYKGETLCKTPPGGKYKNSPWGKGKILSEQEVLFQLAESKRMFGSLLGKEVKEFIYPFGLYNAETIKILETTRIYERAYTCDEGFETKTTHPFKLPRFLIEHSRSVSQTIDQLLSLKPTG